MDQMWSIMDMIVLGCGLYAFYTIYLMKTTGELKTTFLLNKDMNIRNCKDIEAYKAFIFPRLLVFATATTLYGAAGLFNTYVAAIGIAYTVVAALFFVVLIWYAIQLRNSVKKYF